MGKAQRTKGLSFEREVARGLRDIFPEARRNLEYQEGQGVDLDKTGRLKIQCKCMKVQPNIPKVMQEVQCSEEDIPVVAFKVTNKGTYVAMKWEDWLELIEAVDEHCTYLEE